MERDFQMWDEVQLLCGGPVMTVYEAGDRGVYVVFEHKGQPINCWVDRRMVKPSVSIALVLRVAAQIDVQDGGA